MFDFEPKLFIIWKPAIGLHAYVYSNAMTMWVDSVIWIRGQKYVQVCNNSIGDLYFSVSGNTISWYSTTDLNQLNYSTEEYIYFAIG